MKPKGSSFTELFNNLEQWENTRSKIDFIGFADHVLWRSYTISERRSVFEIMNESGLSLALEVGAVKHWGFGALNAYFGGDMDRYGEAMFFIQHRDFWSRFEDEGAKIKAFALDEPLVDVMANLSLYGFENTERGRQEAFDWTLEQTARFIECVREQYPDAAIGDIQVFPHFSSDLVIDWIEALEARLRAGPSGRGQDFFRMDIDWADNRVYDFRSGNVRRSGWAEVKIIADYCKSGCRSA
jgi:hypothetical protein